MIKNIVGSPAPKYGFQKSENTRAAVVIYQHNDDPIVSVGSKKENTPTTLIGNKASDVAASVLSVNTSKSISEASGKFNVTLKPSRYSTDLFNRINDDDWIDIIFYVDKEPYHTFRGIIDEVNRSTAVGSNGATVRTYNIVGRCFGKVWEVTPVWFSPYYNDIITGAVGIKSFQGSLALNGAPDEAAYAYLQSFLEASGVTAGVNWVPPKSMPGIEADTFLGNVEFNSLLNGSKFFQNIPKRTAYNENALMPEGTLWDLAQSYSDPMFTELYVDYLPQGDPFSKNMSSPVGVGEGEMAVIMRDRPFPILPESAIGGYNSTWERLPEFVVQRQELKDDNISKSGYERYNAFHIASKLLQEDMQNHALNIIAPLMDADSIKRHGYRRFDINSNLQPSLDNPIEAGGSNVDAMCAHQRTIARDWYCLNPYMLSGTITLAHGRPDIRIGCRLHVPSVGRNAKTIIPEENYYIETVSHNWSFGAGIRTSLGVTRGWIGDLTSYNNALRKVATRYSVPKLTDIPRTP